MTFKIKKVLDYQFLDGSRDIWINLIRKRLSNHEKTFLITVNPEIIMEAERSAKYKKIIQKAEYLVPEGFGIQWASRRLRQPIEHIFPGIELVEMILAEANENKYSLVSFGAESQIQAKFKKKISKVYPNIQWIGSFHGYVTDEEKKEVANLCKYYCPDIVLVGLGVPAQEQWIDSIIEHVNKGIYMGVGGSFDVLSGEVRRAPKLFRHLKIEWAYRVFTHKRGKKKFVDILRFVVKILNSMKP